MARATAFPKSQLSALVRLKAVRGIGRFYLAGGAAVAFHLRHRRSLDLDLFGPPDASFTAFQSLARTSPNVATVVSVGDATLHLEVGGVPVDVVRFPYATLEPPSEGPLGYRVAGLLDLATNKLATVAKRGLRRDFWDLYAITKSGIRLADACHDYVTRFGVAESDLYHVVKALTWFDDVEPVLPIGMTTRLWREIRVFFEAEAPRLLDERSVRPRGAR